MAACPNAVGAIAVDEGVFIIATRSGTAVRSLPLWDAVPGIAAEIQDESSVVDLPHLAESQMKAFSSSEV